MVKLGAGEIGFKLCDLLFSVFMHFALFYFALESHNLRFVVYVQGYITYPIELLIMVAFKVLNYL